MPQDDMPMNTAHHHAANAEDFLANGLLILAAEEHHKAADAYLASSERTNDDSAKRTLKMLYNEHSKAESELRRKIEKLTEEGKDPSLPQKLPGQTSSDSKTRGVTASSSPSVQKHPIDPESPDESFMLLAGQKSDPGDAFNQFWNIMQGMLDNLSQPVAFATVPLGGTSSGVSTPSRRTALQRKGSLSSDTDPDEGLKSRFAKRLGLSIDSRGSKTQPKTTLASIERDESDEGSFEEAGDDLSESFFVIPSGDSMSTVKKENALLKSELEMMKKRVEATEKVLQLRKEQDLQLRDSIYLATKEAQRAMGTPVVQQRPGLDFSLNMNAPVPPLPNIPGFKTARELQYAKRVKELEEELRLSRVELEKTKAENTRLKERWAKVKESAKRKKESKAAAEAARTAVNERIIEEPEAEEREAASVQQ